MSDGRLSTARLEAFSDGVIAVIITIMVLDLRVPARSVDNVHALHELAPLLFLYLLSFVQVGIYWVNHHYMIDDVDHATHSLLWSNLIFLFTLSLFPFATKWVGERGISSFSIALYSLVSVLPALTWVVQAKIIHRITGRLRSTGGRLKQVLSVALYVSAVAVAWLNPYVAIGLLCVVAVMWLVPPGRTLYTREGTI